MKPFCALCVCFFFRRERSHFSPIERLEDAFEVEKSERWSRQSAGTMAVDWSALHSLFPARWDSRAFYRRRENCAWPPKWNEKWTTKLILFNQCIIDNVSERRKKKFQFSMNHSIVCFFHFHLFLLPLLILYYCFEHTMCIVDPTTGWHTATPPSECSSAARARALSKKKKVKLHKTKRDWKNCYGFISFRSCFLSSLCSAACSNIHIFSIDKWSGMRNEMKCEKVLIKRIKSSTRQASERSVFCLCCVVFSVELSIAMPRRRWIRQATLD